MKQLLSRLFRWEPRKKDERFILDVLECIFWQRQTDAWRHLKTSKLQLHYMITVWCELRGSNSHSRWWISNKSNHPDFETTIGPSYPWTTLHNTLLLIPIDYPIRLWDASFIFQVAKHLGPSTSTCFLERKLESITQYIYEVGSLLVDLMKAMHLCCKVPDN